MSPKFRMNRGLPSMQGVAAIEFALAFMVLFVIFYGLLTFSDVFFKMQTISRASEDGARMGQRLTVGGSVTLSDSGKSSIAEVVYASVAKAYWVEGDTEAERLAWAQENVDVELGSSNVQVTFPYGESRLLPYIPVLDMSSWLLGDSDVVGAQSWWGD
ncbi:MAG: TadE/TadG family type IV pilus assembly protein [Comamonas sp.]